MVTEIVAEEVDFADSKTDGSVSSAPASAATESYMPTPYQVPAKQMEVPSFVEVPEQERLTF